MKYSRGRRIKREGAKPPPLPNPLPFINTQGKGVRGIGHQKSRNLGNIF